LPVLHFLHQNETTAGWQDPKIKFSLKINSPYCTFPDKFGTSTEYNGLCPRHRQIFGRVHRINSKPNLLNFFI
jgi:hypothetical protein